VVDRPHYRNSSVSVASEIGSNRGGSNSENAFDLKPSQLFLMCAPPVSRSLLARTRLFHWLIHGTSVL